MNCVAVAAAIASGTLLPLMDIVFGKFVTTFNNFAIGTLSPEDYRKEVNKFTLVHATCHDSLRSLILTGF